MKELIEEKNFEMRAYDKVELALLYCPGRSAETALKTLMRWIKQCQPLMQALGGIGYNAPFLFGSFGDLRCFLFPLLFSFLPFGLLLFQFLG